jgi:hypothetical protein
MFDRENAIANWRASLDIGGELSQSDLLELENHLEEAIETLMAIGLSEEEAFLVAQNRIGKPNLIRAEFAKVHPFATWRAPVFWAAVGVAWTLGVQVILENAIPLGAFVMTRLALPLLWLKVWTFVALVGGPVIALSSVAAWMRRYPSSHPKTGRALFATLATAVLLLFGLAPLLNRLNLWKGLDAQAWRSLQPVWQTAARCGLALTTCVGSVVVIRLRSVLKRIDA